MTSEPQLRNFPKAFEGPREETFEGPIAPVASIPFVFGPAPARFWFKPRSKPVQFTQVMLRSAYRSAKRWQRHLQSRAATLATQYLYASNVALEAAVGETRSEVTRVKGKSADKV